MTFVVKLVPSRNRMVRSPSRHEQDAGRSSSVRTNRNLPLSDDPISFVGGTIRLPAKHRVLHGCSWRFPFDCGAKTDSRHDQSANCQSRCKTCAPRLRQVILPEVWPLQLKENSKCQGRDENPRRSSRSCAGSGVGACRCGHAIQSRIRRRRRHITDLVKAGIQNTLAKNQSNSGGFTLGRRGVGPQAQTAIRTTAATIRSDVARITLRMRQIRGDEIIFSDRRDRIRDMVIFLHCYSGRHVVLLAINTKSH
jgi:hypothetical protein